MSNEIIIISPEFGDGRGGVADYTSRVVEEWRGQWPLRFLVPSGDYPIPDGAESFARNSNALRAKLPSSGGKLLVQYSAYGFDRHGFPRWLLRALTDWKHETRGRLVVMFHEIWTFWPRWNRNRIVQTLHRRAIGQLVSAADATFTSTAGQGEHLRAVGARSIEVLPVGTNIRVSHEAVARKEPGVAVLFGLQASRVKALELMKADLRALSASACLTKIITVGGGNTASGRAKEEQLLRGLSLRGGFAQRGALPEEEISYLLSTASFGISAQDELSLTKSGTFMAYAAHGLNILSPSADRRGPGPLCWCTRPSELLANRVTAAELRDCADQLRSWQQRVASWPRIAARFADALGLSASAAAVSLS